MVAPASPALTARERARVNQHVQVIADDLREQQAAITAAATRVEPDKNGRWKLRAREAWQEDVFAYYDNVPELKFATLYVQNSTSKIRLIAAARVGDDEPIPADADTSPFSEQEQKELQAQIGRLRSQRGGQSRLFSRLCAQLFLVGECHLLGSVEKPTIPEQPNPLDLPTVPVPTQPESWEVLSINELTEQNGRLSQKPHPNDPAIPIDTAAALVIRIHQEHLQYRDLPDSSVNGVLDAMEELAILCRVIRATGKSRIAQSSIIGIPHELSSPPIGDDGQPSGPSPVARDLMAHFITPIGDEGSASAAAPFIVEGPSDALKAMKESVIELTRPLDATMAGQRQELRATIATGIDLPAEVLTGVADLNHWTAWQVTEETFKAHLEPRVILACDALTIGYLRACLTTPKAEGGPGWSQERADLACVWYDASRLVAHPNREKSAQAGHDAGVISDRVLVEALGFSENDMPDTDEVVRRLAAKRASFDGAMSEVLLRTLIEDLVVRRVVPATSAVATSDADGLVVEEPAVLPARATVVDDTAPTEPVEVDAPTDSTPAEGPPAGGSPVAGSAARPNPGVALSRRLVDIDRDLRARLEVECELALASALVKAGNRANTAVRRAGGAGPKTLAESTSRPLLVAALGRSVTASLGLTDDELLADAFTDLTSRFDTMTAAAQAAVLADLEAALTLSPQGVEGLAARQTLAREAAAAALLERMVQLAKARLYDPNPKHDVLGESDLSSTVPVSLVRGVLGIAGGATSTDVGTGEVQTAQVTIRGGIGTGQDVVSTLRAAGADAEEYEWVYGISRNRFEGHVQLAGVRFRTFTDPVLANHSGWPTVPYFTPGDHDGCRCDAYPVWHLTDQERFFPHSGPDGASARDVA